MMKLITLIGLLILVGGCQVGRVDGVSVSAGAYERGLWFDSDGKEYRSSGWGMKLDFVVGHMIRPVPKFWIRGSNPWKGDVPWFVIRVPMIGPFVSVSLGKVGAYLGFKTFLVEERHCSLERYGRWMREGEFPDSSGKLKVYMQLSGSVRRTRWK